MAEMTQMVQLERTQYRQLLRRAELLCDPNNDNDKVYLPRAVANQLFHESRAYHYLKLSLRIRGIRLNGLDGLGDARENRSNKARTTRQKRMREVTTSNLGKIDERHEEHVAPGELERENLESEKLTRKAQEEASSLFTSVFKHRYGQEKPAVTANAIAKDKQNGDNTDLSHFRSDQFTKRASREKTSRGTPNTADTCKIGSPNQDNNCTSSDINSDSELSSSIKTAKAVKMIRVFPKLVDHHPARVNSEVTSRGKSGAAMVSTSSTGGESLIERVKSLKLEAQTARMSAQALASSDDSETRLSELGRSSKDDSSSGKYKKESFTRERWW